MNRQQIFVVIQAHLTDELELPPESITEASRFREDLEADSLDLYMLVQELEDTYGLKISDEEAAEIVTVSQAVDFVMASDIGGDRVAEESGTAGAALDDGSQQPKCCPP